MPVEGLNEDDQLALLKIRDWIESQMGIAYRPGALSILNSRLQQFCYEQNFDSLSHLYQLLNNGQSARFSIKLAQTVSTTHTYFYREPEILESFVQRILPQLEHEANIRIWSAAASSGQEAYTLAILMAEALGISNANRRVQILGTDINANMIRHAERGVYTQDQLKEVPECIRARYFSPVGMGQYQLLSELRNMCTFRRLNLTNTDWPFQRLFHIVFCRNVLYYFLPAQQEFVVNEIYKHTQAGGYLFTSLTESLSKLETPWNKIDHAIYTK